MFLIFPIIRPIIKKIVECRDLHNLVYIVLVFLLEESNVNFCLDLVNGTGDVFQVVSYLLQFIGQF